MFFLCWKYVRLFLKLFINLYYIELPFIFSSPSLIQKISNIVIICPLKRETCNDLEKEYRRLSASLVPVPVVYFCFESIIKKQLPMMSYDSFLRRKTVKIRENDSVCTVCLNGIAARHEVVPFNCCQVFHRECLDASTDLQGHGTSPLYADIIKLLPTLKNHDEYDHHDHHEDQLGYDGDPWRRERIIYLFGEEY